MTKKVEAEQKTAGVAERMSLKLPTGFRSGTDQPMYAYLDPREVFKIQETANLAQCTFYLGGRGLQGSLVVHLSAAEANRLWGLALGYRKSVEVVEELDQTTLDVLVQVMVDAQGKRLAEAIDQRVMKRLPDMVVTALKDYVGSEGGNTTGSDGSEGH